MKLRTKIMIACGAGLVVLALGYLAALAGQELDPSADSRDDVEPWTGN